MTKLVRFATLTPIIGAVGFIVSNIGSAPAEAATLNCRALFELLHFAPWLAPWVYSVCGI
jgi:hypothetical protein